MEIKPAHKPTEHSRNYSQIAFDYAQDAVRDKKGKKYCKYVRLAAKRHLSDIKRQSKAEFGYTFDPWHGNDVCDFIEKLPHIEGTWDTATISLEPPQIFILVSVFGWRKKLDGLRRFTSVYIEMARKGAKSTLTSGVSLYCLTCEQEVGPQIIIGATTGEQAQKVFNPAKRMVEKTQDLREAFGVEAWARSITCKDNGGFIQTINSKSSTQDGWNPHMGVLDELHAHKDRSLYDVIKSAFGSRKNPMIWIITTAGYNVEGVCYEQRSIVIKFLEEIFEADHYFGIIYTIDEGDSEFDPKVWIKANPMLGVTPTIESMESYAKEAQISPMSLGEFKTKRLNVWTNAKNAWLNTELWKQCDGPIGDPKGHKLCGGLDLASTTDIAAFVLTWYVDGRLKILPRFYLPEDTVRPRTEKGNVPYQVWVDQGYLVTTPGNVTDYTYIQQDIESALAMYDISEIAFDEWNSSDLVTRLLDNEAPMVGFRQGPKSYNPPMREMERLMVSKMIDHGGNPVLSWMASNLIARKDVNNNMAPDKGRSAEKIDGMVGALMALGRLMFIEETGGLDDFLSNPVSI